MADEVLVLVLFAHSVGSAEADQQESATSDGSVLVVGFTMAREIGTEAAVFTHFLLVITIAVEEAALSECTSGQSKN